jgi:hypothetical protein
MAPRTKTERIKVGKKEGNKKRVMEGEGRFVDPGTEDRL